MNIVFFVYHPVEPHFYNHIAAKLQEKGHQILFILFEKEGIEENLLTKYGYKYIKIIGYKSSFASKLFKIIPIVLKIRKILLDNKTDIIFSATSLYAGLSCFGTKIFRIGFTDTETAKLNNKIAFPFFQTIITPDCFYEKVPLKKHIPVKSYKELAYLLPIRFKRKNDILNNLGLKANEKITLMRFSSLRSLHDIGLKSKINKNEFSILKNIIELSKYTRVFISCTERELGPEFDKYKLNIHPADYMHFLSFCSLYIGEGTTTASEAGVLGVPWIALRPESLGYLKDQENNYKLGMRTNDIDVAFTTAIKWLKDDDLLVNWKKKRVKLLKDKIDVSSFLIWFIENYPNSHKLMKENPDYQLNFK